MLHCVHKVRKVRLLGRVSLRCLQPNQERVLVTRYQPSQSAEITPIFTVSRQLPPQHAASVGFYHLFLWFGCFAEKKK